MGRPTKRTPESEAIIIRALSNGSTRTDAAAAAGISRETLYQWMGDFPDLSDAITRAEGDCANRMAQRIFDEATKEGGDWRAAETWLKKRRRDEWADNISVGKWTDEQLIAYVAGGAGGNGAAEPETTRSNRN